MKKLSFILLLLPNLAFAGGPKWTYPTVRGLDDEMSNVYHDIKNPIINVGNASTMTITSNLTVPNGVASTDAAAFGQIFSGFQAPIFATTASATTTTSNVYQLTGLSAPITLKLISHRVRITVSVQARTDNAATANVFLTLMRNASNLLGGNGFVNVGGLGVLQDHSSFTFIDSPSSISVLTYAVYIKNDDNATTVRFNVGTATTSILLEEIL